MWRKKSLTQPDPAIVADDISYASLEDDRVAIVDLRNWTIVGRVATGTRLMPGLSYSRPRLLEIAGADGEHVGTVIRRW